MTPSRNPRLWRAVPEIGETPKSHRVIPGSVGGLYALYLDGRLVYIGQSFQLRNRVREHVWRFGIGSEPHRWLVKYRIECDEDERLNAEWRLSSRLRPRWDRNRIEQSRFAAHPFKLTEQMIRARR